MISICRTPATEDYKSIAAAGIGGAVSSEWSMALAGDELIDHGAGFGAAFERCVHATRQSLVARAFHLGELTVSPDGPQVVFEVIGDIGSRVRVVRLSCRARHGFQRAGCGGRPAAALLQARQPGCRLAQQGGDRERTQELTSCTRL